MSSTYEHASKRLCVASLHSSSSMVSSTAAEADQLAPIVFSLHDIKPDVYLQVFEQAFHVHSLVLKSQSEFFYKYLDSPDKVPLGPLAEFKYQWVTKVDEDGTWSLVAENEQVNIQISIFQQLQ
jgi:hypothetical protein